MWPDLQAESEYGVGRAVRDADKNAAAFQRVLRGQGSSGEQWPLPGRQGIAQKAAGRQQRQADSESLGGIKGTSSGQFAVSCILQGVLCIFVLKARTVWLFGHGWQHGLPSECTVNEQIDIVQIPHGSSLLVPFSISSGRGLSAISLRKVVCVDL